MSKRRKGQRGHYQTCQRALSCHGKESAIKGTSYKLSCSSGGKCFNAHDFSLVVSPTSTNHHQTIFSAAQLSTPAAVSLKTRTEVEHHSSVSAPSNVCKMIRTAAANMWIFSTLLVFSQQVQMTAFATALGRARSCQGHMGSEAIHILWILVRRIFHK